MPEIPYPVSILNKPVIERDPDKLYGALHPKTHRIAETCSKDFVPHLCGFEGECFDLMRTAESRLPFFSGADKPFSSADIA